MSRATVFYLVTLVASVLGLWGILRVGAQVKAPADIGGVWRVDPSSLRAAGGQDGVEDWPRRLRIEQSGLFVQLAIDEQGREDYRLSPMGRTDESFAYELIGPGRRLTIESGEDRDHIRVRLEDAARPGAIEFDARRRESAAVPQAGTATEPNAAREPDGHHLILILLGEIAVVIALSQIMGRIFEYIHQPKVMGEMVAGIMLGPSLLGWVMPGVSAALFPADAVPYLSVLSQVGVVLFLFLIGLELDPKLLRQRGHAALVISHVSIVAPFLLGGGLALYLYPLVFNDTQEMRFSSVALFMGAALSITAFPVLARILTERNLHKSAVGAVTITCAAVDDVTAWCMLAFVVAVARADGMTPALMTAALSVVYILIMFLAVKPLLGRLQAVYERTGHVTRGVLGIVFLLLLTSACATEAIGIHALFGAFLIGVVMPKGTRFAVDLNEKIEDFTLVFLLPVFFAYTGLRTHIGVLQSSEMWLLTLLLVVVACLGKFGGSTLAARACGMGWRESSAIGILMNTRGLMQLVILNVGSELGVITDAVFAMMVIMALVTTFLTTPVLNWVYPDRILRKARDLMPGEADKRYGVLVPISLPRSGPPLLRLADMITGPDNAARSIIGLHLRPAVEREAFRAAVDDTSADRSATLDAIIAQAAREGVPVEPVSFVTREPGADIVRVAHEQGVQLILMGFHNPVIGHTILGGTVHRVLENAESDVAIFVDRGMHVRPKSILVPYMGSPHDKLALEMAARMARHSGAAVTVLHVVSPERESERPRLGAKENTDQVFADPTQPAPVTFKVVPHADPIAAVLEQAKPFDLVAIGIAEEWGLTSQLFGWRAERIARDCPSSLLILRKYIRPAHDLPMHDRAPSPAASPA